MSDIVDRLRKSSPYSTDGTMNSNNRLILEAAERIESDRRLIEKARDALREIKRIEEQALVGMSARALISCGQIAAETLTELTAHLEGE